MMKLVENILKGVLGGGFAGFILGFYLTVLTKDYVVKSDHFQTAVLYEQAEVRYALVVMLSCIGLFALMGPFVVASETGPWLRHAAYGLVGCLALVVGGAYLITWLRNEPLVYYSKLAGMPYIDAAREYGIPTAFVLGPIVGILIGRVRKKWYKQKSGSTECNSVLSQTTGN